MTTSPIPEILTHLDAGVLSLTINRLDRKNSITAVMYAAMADVLKAMMLYAFWSFRAMKRFFQRAMTLAIF